MRIINRFNVHDLTRVCEAMLDGEPVFIIRAQDALAVRAIQAYKDAAALAGSDVVAPTTETMRRVEEWQRANPQRVKRPDY